MRDIFGSFLANTSIYKNISISAVIDIVIIILKMKKKKKRFDFPFVVKEELVRHTLCKESYNSHLY